MRCARRWFGLAVLLLTFPVLAADDKKEEKKPASSTQDNKPEAKKKDDKKKDDKKSADGDEEPKKGDKKSAASVKLSPRVKPQYTQILAAKIGKLDNAPKYGIILKEPYLNGNKVEFRDKEVEIEAADELVVRTEVLPLRFDDKGRPIQKPYTKAEKKKLRGPDDTLPGYMADIDSLKPGQVVSIYLGKKKNAAKTDPPVIVMICIIAEPAN